MRDETQGAETEKGSEEAEEATFVAVYKYLLATDESSERYPVCLSMCCDLWYHSTCITTLWGKNSIRLCSTCSYKLIDRRSMSYITVVASYNSYYLLIQFLNTFFKDSFCQKALSPGQSSVKYIVLVAQATPFTGLRD